MATGGVSCWVAGGDSDSGSGTGVVISWAVTTKAAAISAALWNRSSGSAARALARTVFLKNLRVSANLRHALARA